MALLTGGCWSTPDLVDGAFTQAQWEHLQAELTPPLTQPCALSNQSPWPGEQCDALARLGQELFFDPALSINDSIACATCHDPGTLGELGGQGWFVDTRAVNHVSETPATARGWTKRNTPSVVNAGLKSTLASKQPVFTWIGEFKSPGAVIELALRAAMGRDPATSVLSVIRERPEYARRFVELFGSLGDDAQLFANLELAFDAYLRRLDSVDSKFDRYLAGADVFTASEQRGFAVFVGPGMCLECHSGPMLSDFKPHVTGVPQVGANVPFEDLGRNMTGAFLTPTLRNVAQTGPYMHDGALATLDDVIWFYRQGGGAAGFTGDKDPRMVPLDITDDQAHDLEAFLRTLTGTPIADELRRNLLLVDPRSIGDRPLATPSNPDESSCAYEGAPLAKYCHDVCTDIANDVENCGDCDRRCPTGSVCMLGCYCPTGMCGP